MGGSCSTQAASQADQPIRKQGQQSHSPGPTDSAAEQLTAADGVNGAPAGQMSESDSPIASPEDDEGVIKQVLLVLSHVSMLPRRVLIAEGMLSNLCWYLLHRCTLTLHLTGRTGVLCGHPWISGPLVSPSARHTG